MPSTFTPGRATVCVGSDVYLVLLHTNHARSAGPNGLQLVVQKASGEVVETADFAGDGDGTAIDCWRIAIVDLIRRVTLGLSAEVSIDSWPTRTF